ncbi:VTT domain-containing protein [Methylophaga pinxianii]|uniref:VTT domain-containing protein n=1 Tax=Methylophaga pinxianii TaxID=2881052 RepID=UPI001CF393BB|nr:VTT domain-containing protein [Methylophaga pinxianii]MCB2428248.1 VTT domain-containing protein [Methylophaga pinxianii]UPH45867.1 VTT domain-containing protein [Methylophaga pinxianii]
MHDKKIIRPEENCWRYVNADRAALLVDGEKYFGTLHTAISQARYAVYILAWDIDSRLGLLRGEQKSDLPAELGNLINALLDQRPELSIYILNWDWAMLYTLEREWLPLFRPGWKKQARLHYQLDGECPFGGSQHQKIVVIDDKLAFCGGIDPGKYRWDTSDHAPDDKRRIDPDNEAYPPFHDMQMMVDGDAAQSLAELARDRWYKATGEQLPKVKHHEQDIWPSDIKPDFENVNIAIARTLPEFKDQAEITEVETLYLDAIASAEKLIYIENQYFTSWKVAEVLAQRLADDQGLEVVIVCPKMTGGWLEQHTMDVLRSRVSRKLFEADKHGQLRVCYPHHEALGNAYISLHSKLLIVDDVFLRVGSANLSNRSMGLDSECDLAIEAENEEQLQAIKAFRQRLLCEHLGLKNDELEALLTQHGSLIKLLDAREDASRTLRTLDCEIDDSIDGLTPTADYIDPERPVDSVEMSRKLVPIDESKSPKKQIVIAAMVLLAVIALTALWKWTPLNEFLTPENLQQLISTLNDYPFTPVIVIGIFALAGLIAVPLTLLVVTVAISFGAWPGSLYAILGSLLSAVLGYVVGEWLGRSSVSKMAGSKLNRLSKRLANHGVMAIITVRIIPVAPFTVINLVAGASHIKLKDFIWGTLIGMLPGILAITIFANSLLRVVKQPKPIEIVVFVLVVFVIGALMYGVKKWLNRISTDS